MSRMTYEEMKALLPAALQPNLPFTWQNYKAFLEAYSLNHWIYTNGVWSRDKMDRDSAMKQIASVFFEWPQIYRSKLPVHLLARCPICGGEVWEAVDTGSLSGLGWWMNEPRGVGWFGPRHRAEGKRISEVSYHTACPHIQAVTYGVNLNGILPNDASSPDYIMIGSEEPGLFLPLVSQPDEYAVIRTLAVGREDDAVWQPRYTAYFMSYFSAQPEAGKLLKVLGSQNPYRATSEATFVWPTKAESYDLASWVEQGQLQWLEPQPPHALCRGGWAEYPYRHLTGLRRRWVITRGQVYTSFHLFRCLNKYPNGNFYEEEKQVWREAIAKRPLRNVLLTS